MKKHELAVKAATFILLIIGLAYVGYVNELVNGRIQDAHRFIICVVSIYGVFRLSQDIPLLVCRTLLGTKNAR